MKVKSESEVAQSCLTLSDPMDCDLAQPKKKTKRDEMPPFLGCQCWCSFNDKPPFPGALAQMVKNLPANAGHVG